MLSLDELIFNTFDRVCTLLTNYEGNYEGMNYVAKTLEKRASVDVASKLKFCHKI